MGGTATISGGGNFPFLTSTSPGGIGAYTVTLDLDCDGTGSGTLQAGLNGSAVLCTLQFGGDFTLEDGAGIGGAGNVEVPSGGELWVTSGASYDVTGNTTIDGGTIEFDDSAEAGTLNVSSGDLTGSGTLTVVAGPTIWTGGTMDGVGTTITEGTLQIGLATDTNDLETLDGRTLTNAGTATWAGGGSFSQPDGGTFVNEANASFTIENDLTWSSDGTGTFANAGSLKKSAGTGATILQAALDDTGSVSVQQGTLDLAGGGIATGTAGFTVGGGATLQFSGGFTLVQARPSAVLASSRSQAATCWSPPVLPTTSQAPP